MMTPKFACPGCGGWESNVVDTGPASDTNGIYRRRKCACGFRYNTREVIEIVEKKLHRPISGGHTIGK